MQLEELRQRANSRAPQGPEEAARFERDVRAFFASIPEPPLYRRKADPALARARKLTEVGEALLSRAQVVEPRSPLEPALEAHLLALWLVAENKVEAGEEAWRRAVALERAASSAQRLWRRSDDAPLPVFDRATGVSRFDPKAEVWMQVTLVCPRCRKPGDFQLAARQATHRLSCPHCRDFFVAYLGEAHAVVARLRGRVRHMQFRLRDGSGAQSRLEFDDPSGAELLVAAGDRLAFLYAPPERLKGVLNLSTSRVLWLPSSSCFVATAVFGEDTAEVAALRRFRDEVLAHHAAGRGFIRWYYRHGPRLAVVVSRRPWLRGATRAALRALVGRLPPGAHSPSRSPPG